MVVLLSERLDEVELAECAQLRRLVAVAVGPKGLISVYSYRRTQTPMIELLVGLFLAHIFDRLIRRLFY